MIRYRAFRNSDPPALAGLWQSQPSQRGMAQPMTPWLFEQAVCGKPYFEREGLIVAEEGEVLLGFVHAGFGCSAEGDRLDRRKGVICLVMVRPGAAGGTLGSALLECAERYLRHAGAQRVWAGCAPELNPFYLGLYGGGQQQGILASDPWLLQLFQAAGYREECRSAVLQLLLSDFRPPMDRRAVLVRRQYQVDATGDLLDARWWDACTLNAIERTRFQVLGRQQRRSCGEATFWNLEPLAGSWGLRAAELLGLTIAPDRRRQGLATFLLGDALRQLQSTGCALVEAQVDERNVAARGLLDKFGFGQVDAGYVLSRDLS